MDELPRDTKEMPAGLSLERPATNLASLVTTQSLDALRETVLSQWQHQEQFARLAKHGIRPIDRMLFYGPPGNGKTMASQWIAAKLNVPLYRVRCENLIAKYVGQSASNVSAVMQWLETRPACVVLLDEVEQMLISRTDAGSSTVGRELSSAMGVFWQYLDRWQSPTLFILATNLPDRLDSALLSRIDLKMEFGPPTEEQAATVVQYWQEVLHEFGGEVWGPRLLDRSQSPESFRALFHEIQDCVRQHVTAAGHISD